LPDGGLLFDRRTPLFQRQIRQRDLSFSDGELFTCRSSQSERLLVHPPGARKIRFLKQQISQAPHGVCGEILIPTLLPSRQGLFKPLFCARKITLRP
jgi:hypothetical protein